MHARCDSDPLDFATDVCDDCGGEFCDGHLVHPYGPRRPPLCRQCAIALSGVRSSGAPMRKRTRSQIKKRRAELRQQRAEGPATLGFQLFDVPAELARAAASAPGAAGEEGAGSGGRAGVGEEPVGRSLARRLGLGRRRAERAQGGDAGDVDEVDDVDDAGPDVSRPVPGPTPAPSSATVLLTRLREVGAVPATTPAPPPPTAAPSPAPVPEAGWAAPRPDPEPEPDGWPDTLPAGEPTPSDVPAPLPRRRPVPPPLSQRRNADRRPAAPGGPPTSSGRAPRPVPYAPPGFSAWPVDGGADGRPDDGTPGG